MIYENVNNLRVERDIAYTFAKVTDCYRLEKFLPELKTAVPDYIFYDYDNVERGCAEIKRRYIPFGGYADFIIDKKKVEALSRYSKKGIILVGFNDRLSYVWPWLKPPVRE